MAVTIPGTNAIIDISHHNATVNLPTLAANGILGIFHKATQGKSFTDPKFAARRTAAATAGLLWGAYHFGTGDDVNSQVSRFLAVATPKPEDLLVLDFENNPSGASMTLPQARAFVTAIQAATGRFPGLYGGSMLKSLLGSSSDPVLSQCWLWMAQYANAPVIPPAWPGWTMWQYTDGVHGPPPLTITGAPAGCDRDTFNGTPAQLRTFWTGH